MASKTWPKFVVIRWKGEARSALAYKGDLGFPGSVFDDQTAGVWNPMAKVEIEPSKLDGARYFNMRFCHSNKYWARQGGLVSAVSNQPVEDTSDPSCTLFEQSGHDGDAGFDLVHVQSGGLVGGEPDSRVSVVDGENDGRKLSFLDWETLFKMPVMVNMTFRGTNMKFLKVYIHNDGHPYMQFSAPDNSDPTVRHQVELMPEGDIRIKSVSTGAYWRLSPGWILADGQNETTPASARFQPVKSIVNIIALRNVELNRFCNRLTTDGLTDCLNANSNELIDEAKLMVEELVMARRIYNVSYRMDESRVYDEVPYVAGTTTLVNPTDQDRPMSDKIAYEKEMSYSFANSISLYSNLALTIEAGILVIDDTSSIVVDSQINQRFDWEAVTKSSTSVVAPVTVFVPAMSSVKVNYVGTKGTCSVPFSYAQQDTSSVDGKILDMGDIDGIYTGTSCYNFEVRAEKPRPL